METDRNLPPPPTKNAAYQRTFRAKKKLEEEEEEKAQKEKKKHQTEQVEKAEQAQKEKKDRERELARLRKAKQRSRETQITTMDGSSGDSQKKNPAATTITTTASSDGQNNQLALQTLASQLAANGNPVTINLVQNQVQGDYINKVDTMNNNSGNSNRNGNGNTDSNSSNGGNGKNGVTQDYFDKSIADLNKSVADLKDELKDGQAKILHTTSQKAARPNTNTGNAPPSPSDLLGKFTNDGRSSPMASNNIDVQSDKHSSFVLTPTDLLDYALSLSIKNSTVTVPAGFLKSTIHPIPGTNGWIYCSDGKPLFVATAMQLERGCKKCLKNNDGACPKHNNFVFSESFVAGAVAWMTGQTDGLSYCKEVGLQDLAASETEAELKAIRIVKTSLPLLSSKQHLDAHFAAPNTLYVICEDNVATGCIFFGQNDFIDDFDDLHNEATILALTKALGFTFRTTLTLANKEEEEAEIIMAVRPKSRGHLSSYLAVVSDIVIQSYSLYDRVSFEGPSNEVKYELNLDADILEQLCQSISCIEFNGFRLVDVHLEAMGKARDKANELKAFTFYKCEFLVEGTNSLFVGNKESPMKVQVLEIPNSSFFSDCEHAIKSGVLSSLVVSTDTNPTRLDVSKFRSVVNIRRAIIDKDLGELFYSRDTDVGPFNVGLVELSDSNLNIPSKLTPSAVDKAATVDPDDYTHERDYNKAVIDAAKSVLAPP